MVSEYGGGGGAGWEMAEYGGGVVCKMTDYGSAGCEMTDYGSGVGSNIRNDLVCRCISDSHGSVCVGAG